MLRPALFTFRAKDEERVLSHLGRSEERTIRLATISETRSEITNGAKTSATRELVAYDLPDPRNSIHLSRLSDNSGQEERVRNILGAKKSSNCSKNPPYKHKFCYSYLGDGEHDELIDVEYRGTTSAPVPVVLLLSHSKHK